MFFGRAFVAVLFLAGASSLAQSQRVADYDMSGLVYSVEKSREPQNVAADSLNMGCAEILDGFLGIFANDSNKIGTESPMPSGFSLGALDFVMDSCLGHGFYDTGDWRPHATSCTKLYAGVLPQYVGDLVRPVAGRITSSISFRPEFNRMHWGVDFACAVGSPVLAALSGIVVAVGNDVGGYGVYVCIVDEKGVETRYAHLSQSRVSKGEYVERGAVLAISGNSGLSTGPHLHFELRYHGDVVDPCRFFNKK